MKTIPFKGQDFQSLRKSYNSKNLFNDPIFRPNMDSIGYSNKFMSNLNNFGSIKWMRPYVIHNFFLNSAYLYLLIFEIRKYARIQNLW
jgi:hypothetical protein